MINSIDGSRMSMTDGDNFPLFDKVSRCETLPEQSNIQNTNSLWLLHE